MSANVHRQSSCCCGGVRNRVPPLSVQCCPQMPQASGSVTSRPPRALTSRGTRAARPTSAPRRRSSRPSPSSSRRGSENRGWVGEGAPAGRPKARERKAPAWVGGETVSRDLRLPKGEKPRWHASKARARPERDTSTRCERRRASPGLPCALCRIRRCDTKSHRVMRHGPKGGGLDRADPHPSMRSGVSRSYRRGTPSERQRLAQDLAHVTTSSNCPETSPARALRKEKPKDSAPLRLWDQRVQQPQKNTAPPLRRGITMVA